MNGSTRPSRSALIIGLIISFAGVATAEDQERELEIDVGEQVTIPTKDVDKWSEGVKGIIDVRLPQTDQSQFVIVGMVPGQTTLLLIMRDESKLTYRITVRGGGRKGEVLARDNIRLDFYFVELSERSGHTVGLAWPGTGLGAGSIGGTVDVSVESNLRTGRIASATAQVASQVLPRLDLAQASGWAKVMRHASLITRNGAQGRYGSGGEVNVRVGSGTAVGVEKIAHGTAIVVTPRYDKQSGRIELIIEAEVATLGGVSDDVPSRNYTKVSTLVNIEVGQSVLLGGLVARSEEKSSGGLPILSQIPVIGYLFGVKSRAETRTENVLLIVPTVVEAVSPSKRARVSAALSTYEKYDGNVVDALTPPPSKRARSRKKR